MLKTKQRSRKESAVKLLTVDTVSEAREKLLIAAQQKKKQIEFVELEEAMDRVLASDLVSPEPIPSFRRSTVDGYAVRAADTQGAGESIPVFLEIIERIEIGTPAVRMVQPGQCSYVPTGGMIPEGADAVVMVEYCEAFDTRSMAVYDAVSPGRNLIRIGEDIQEESLFLKKGNKAAASGNRGPCFGGRSYGAGLPALEDCHYFHRRRAGACGSKAHAGPGAGY